MAPANQAVSECKGMNIFHYGKYIYIYIYIYIHRGGVRPMHDAKGGREPKKFKNHWSKETL